MHFNKKEAAMEFKLIIPWHFVTLYFVTEPFPLPHIFAWHFVAPFF